MRYKHYVYVLFWLRSSIIQPLWSIFCISCFLCKKKTFFSIHDIIKSFCLEQFFCCSGQNNVFLIDRLFKQTLWRLCTALVSSWESGERFKPTSAPRVKGQCPSPPSPPKKNVYLCLQNRKKLAHWKNEILLLICAMNPTDMFTIHWMKNSSFVYVKHIFLDIFIKGRFNKNVYYSSKTLPFLKKCFSLDFFKKEVAKNLLKVCNHHCV